MNSNAILSSDPLDILFENRNKDYGAYTLRKFYPERIKTSLFIMLGMAAAVSAFTFLPDGKIMSVPFTIEEGSTVVRQMEDYKKPEPPKPPSAATGAQQKFLSAVNIVQKDDSSDLFNDITHLQISNYTDITTITDVPVTVAPAAPGGGGSAAPEKIAAPEISNDHPVDDPDVQASYPGGEKELRRFLERNLQSPQVLAEGESVQVKIKFVVGFDGNLQSFDVLQDGGTGFNNEVIRVLKKMPKWNPGKKGGRNVPVYYCLPVKFAGDE